MSAWGAGNAVVRWCGDYIETVASWAYLGGALCLAAALVIIPALVLYAAGRNAADSLRRNDRR